MRALKRIAVTGAAGFIGSHLVELLLKRDDVDLVLGFDSLTLGSTDNLANVLTDKRYICKKMDIRKKDDLAILLERHRIDGVLHLATTPLVYSLKSPQEAASGIYDMQLALLEVLRAGHFGYLLTFSTSEVYGSSPNLSLDENTRLHPQTTYAAAKAAADLTTSAYSASFGLDTTIIRPFNNFGPRKRVLAGAGIIPTTIKRIANNKNPQIFGTGEASRDFVYVTDTARAVVEAAFSSKSKGEVFNIATGITRSMTDVVRDISRLMGKELAIDYQPARSADVSALKGDASKIKSMLGYTTKMDWEEGLRNCINYYSDQRLD